MKTTSFVRSFVAPFALLLALAASAAAQMPATKWWTSDLYIRELNLTTEQSQRVEEIQDRHWIMREQHCTHGRNQRNQRSGAPLLESSVAVRTRHRTSVENRQHRKPTAALRAFEHVPAANESPLSTGVMAARAFTCEREEASAKFEECLQIRRLREIAVGTQFLCRLTILR